MEDLIKRCGPGLSGPAKKRRKGIPRVEIEFEEEMDLYPVPASAA